jgi:hypothetical protein
MSTISENDRDTKRQKQKQIFMDLLLKSFAVENEEQFRTIVGNILDDPQEEIN